MAGALAGLSTIVLHASCTTHEALGQPGTACVYDEQCVAPLACVCVRRLSTDDEGVDYILQNGFCAAAKTRCPTDGGVPDSRSAVDVIADASDGEAEEEIMDASPAPSDASGG